MRRPAIGLVLVLLGTAACGSEEAEPPSRFPTPWECFRSIDCDLLMVAAHRGYTLHAPENSLAAIRAAKAIGVDFVEVDVRHTADDILVLMHDAEVDRTTTATGTLSDFTWTQIEQETLTRGTPDDPESMHVPRFAEALELAKELGLMLYVDEKTHRGDLVRQLIREGDYYNHALVRDELPEIAEHRRLDERMWLMPPVRNLQDLDAVTSSVAGLRVVEILLPGANAELTEEIRRRGLYPQQDVFAGGDIAALGGDYTGWRTYVEAGARLLQTNHPQLLVPAVRTYRETGTFPAMGPGIDL